MAKTIRRTNRKQMQKNGNKDGKLLYKLMTMLCMKRQWKT